MVLHELPADERAEHFATDQCPCSPLRTAGERPDHLPGALLIHWPFRPDTRDQAADDAR